METRTLFGGRPGERTTQRRRRCWWVVSVAARLLSSWLCPPGTGRWCPQRLQHCHRSPQTQSPQTRQERAGRRAERGEATGQPSSPSTKHTGSLRAAAHRLAPWQSVHRWRLLSGHGCVRGSGGSLNLPPPWPPRGLPLRVAEPIAPGGPPASLWARARETVGPSGRAKWASCAQSPACRRVPSALAWPRHPRPRQVTYNVTCAHAWRCVLCAPAAMLGFIPPPHFSSQLSLQPSRTCGFCVTPWSLVELRSGEPRTAARFLNPAQDQTGGRREAAPPRPGRPPHRST